MGISVAILSGWLIRKTLPIELFLGKSNIPINFLIAFKNLLLLIILVALFLISISVYRNYRLKKMIIRNQGKLEKVGRIRMVSPLSFTPHGRKLGSLGIAQYYLSIFLIISLFFIWTLFVEFRLIAIIVAIAFWGLTFLGITVNPKENQEPKEYQIEVKSP